MHPRSNSGILKKIILYTYGDPSIFLLPIIFAGDIFEEIDPAVLPAWRECAKSAERKNSGPRIPAENGCIPVIIVDERPILQHVGRLAQMVRVLA